MTPAEYRRSSSLAKWTRRSALLAACAASLTLIGCGGGQGFDGGGIPPGKAVLTGRVVAAENTQVPLSNAHIEVRATYSTTKPGVVGTDQTQTLRTTADDLGNFSIQNVPTGLYTGLAAVTVTTDDPRRIPENLDFALANGRGANLVVALTKDPTLLQRARTVTLSPAIVALTPGAQVSFQARVLDAAGNTLSVSPTLLFSDDFGTIGSDGTFVGAGTGTGTLSAFWYDAAPAHANVIVNSDMPISPPPPPNDQTVSTPTTKSGRSTAGKSP
jgi:hypothetical protein